MKLPTIIGAILVAVVIILVISFRRIDVLVVSTESSRVTTSGTLLAGSSQRTLAGLEVWTVPIWTFAYHRIFGVVGDGKELTVTRVKSPVQITLTLVGRDEVAPEHAAQLQKLVDISEATGRDFRLARLDNTNDTLAALAAVAQARGRFEVRLFDFPRIAGEQISDDNAQMPPGASRAIDSDGNPITVLLGQRQLYLALQAPLGRVTVQGFQDSGGDLYAVWLPPRSVDSDARPGHSSTVDITGSDCRCYVGPNVTRSFLREPTLSCPVVDGPEVPPYVRMCDAIPATAVWPIGAPVLRVLVVVSPLYKPRPNSLGASIDYLQKLLDRVLFDLTDLNDLQVPRVLIEEVVADQLAPGIDSTWVTQTEESALVRLANDLRENAEISIAPLPENRLYHALDQLRQDRFGDLVIYSASNVPEFKKGARTSCGVTSAYGADTRRFFAVVNGFICSTGDTTLAHEVGHLLGARHEIQEDDSSGPMEPHATRWRLCEPNSSNRETMNAAVLPWRGTITSVIVTERVPYFSHTGAICDGDELGNSVTANELPVAKRHLLRIADLDVDREEGTPTPWRTTTGEATETPTGTPLSPGPTRTPTRTSQTPEPTHAILSTPTPPQTPLLTPRTPGPTRTPPPPPPPEPTRTPRDNERVICDAIADRSGCRNAGELSVRFSTATAVLTTRQLDEARTVVGRILERNPATVMISGFADDRGGDAENLALSWKRVKTIEDLLRQEYGKQRRMPPAVFRCAYGKHFRSCDESLRADVRRLEERRVDIELTR